MRLAKGFFLLFLDANSVHRQRRPASGTATGNGSLEGVSLSKIGFEYINGYHFIKLVGVEHVRIDVGCLFLEIGIFREFSKK